MKITHKHLRRIIKEELSYLIKEADRDIDADSDFDDVDTDSDLDNDTGDMDDTGD